MIVIFEGGSTSGKSTLSNMLEQHLVSHTVALTKEHLSFQKLFDGSIEKKSAVPWYKDLICKGLSENPDLLIFDRLHFSGAAAKLLSEEEFVIFDRWLGKQTACLVFYLSYGLETTEDRLARALEHRDAEWKAHIQETEMRRGVPYHEYLNNQLRRMEQARQRSGLKTIHIDVTAVKQPDYKKLFAETVLPQLVEAGFASF